jgi:hypothetical protein
MKTADRETSPAARAPRPAPDRAAPETRLARMQRTLGNGQLWRMLARRSPAGPVSGEVAGSISAARGGGAGLGDTVRRDMETAFGADFRGVRVHTDARADTLSRSLGARAFATGSDLFFRSGEFSPGSPDGRKLLAHELTHVVQQGGTAAPLQRALEVGPPDDVYEREADAAARAVAAGERVAVAGAGTAGLVQRDLVREPPGRAAEPVPLTEEQVQAAIRFNGAAFNARSTRMIQDIIGAPVTGVFDADTIHMVVEWQADFGHGVDGMIGMNTLRTICLEMIAEGMRGAVIDLIVDGHDMPTAGLVSITFDRTLAGDNARTGGPIPGDSTVRIGPLAFRQGYEGLVHTIRHELEHVQQRRAGLGPQSLREFLAEGVEIMSVGMRPEGFAGFMDDAGRAIFHWNALPAATQAANRARFDEMRGRVRQRFNAAPAAQRAAQQAVMDRWNAVP